MTRQLQNAAADAIHRINLKNARCERMPKKGYQHQAGPAADCNLQHLANDTHLEGIMQKLVLSQMLMLSTP